jgi:hypothetical protein
MKNPIYYWHSSPIKRITTVAILLFFVTPITMAYQYKPDKTKENVQKKVVITKHEAQIFRRLRDVRGKKAPFMQVYFLMKPEAGGRIPVSFRPFKTGRPDGWLDKKSFVEWNTLQMIKLESQSGRKLAKIFEKRYCADLFGRFGRERKGCRALGEEPNRFASNNDLQLLIPVFQKSRYSYQGGFISVQQKESIVTATSSKTTTHPQVLGKPRLGYDIVFVMDSHDTKSLSLPTKKVLQTFIKQIQESLQNDKFKKMPIRVGLLFYRGRRDQNTSCNIGYLTKWGQRLTRNLDRVIKAVTYEKGSNCSYKKNEPEAVLDALNRVLYDTPWDEKHFKSIILVGEHPPYPPYDPRNPMKLKVEVINKRALKKNVRILAFKLGDHDKSFEKLALNTAEKNKGRYLHIPQKGHVQLFKKNLLKAMTNEWQMLTVAQHLIDDKSNLSQKQDSGVDQLNDQAFLKKHNLTQYDALVIRARLPNTMQTSQVIPEFVKGWIPQEIQRQSVVGEYIFMDKFSLKKLINTLSDFVEATLVGYQEGGVAFIKSIQNVLAAQTRVPVHRLFKSGESLQGILKKANILPFKTDILTFTAQEVNTWKPSDYIRINTILKEKTKVLIEFMNNPRNLRYFGKTPHLYIPKAFFP